MGTVTVVNAAHPAAHPQRTHSWGRSQDRYERAFDQNRACTYRWRQGDIAFLKPEDAFTAEEHKALIEPAPGQKHGYLPPKATGHPVIILSSPSENSTHVLVTPVSAYSSGDYNDFLPPWRQDPHKWKNPLDFRSFYGCARYNGEHPFLYLEDNKSMPKPRASWLYIQSLWAVPLTVIGRFTKTRDLLRTRQDSIEDLLDHMRSRCRRWKECTAELAAYECAANGMDDATPTGKRSWRDQDLSRRGRSATPAATITTTTTITAIPPRGGNKSTAPPASQKTVPIHLKAGTLPPSSSSSSSWASVAARPKHTGATSTLPSKTASIAYAGPWGNNNNNHNTTNVNRRAFSALNWRKVATKTSSASVTTTMTRVPAC